VEKQELGPPGIQPAPPPAIDFNEVIVDFELATDIGGGFKVGRWAAALGPIFKDGEFTMSVPPDVIKAIGLPTVSDLDFDEVVLPDDMSVGVVPNTLLLMDILRVKIFVSAVYNNQLQTNMIYKGVPEVGDLNDDGNSIHEYVQFQQFYFEGCGCSRGNFEPGWEQHTEAFLACVRERNDATRKVQYEVECRFHEDDGEGFGPVDHSRATTWIRNLVTS
jgi:hypothetical protein